ncbi:hypothetical protein KSP40_PGU018191 [Platanthera guangdongensis]|uniref:Uncharacterized protein n=1 Tax=Platanthera guangdongensis TaxID=2320717 RepID=A0ABR2MEU5_9ASPA
MSSREVTLVAGQQRGTGKKAKLERSLALLPVKKKIADVLTKPLSIKNGAERKLPTTWSREKASNGAIGWREQEMEKDRRAMLIANAVVKNISNVLEAAITKAVFSKWCFGLKRCHNHLYVIQCD